MGNKYKTKKEIEDILSSGKVMYANINGNERFFIPISGQVKSDYLNFGKGKSPAFIGESSIVSTCIYSLSDAVNFIYKAGGGSKDPIINTVRSKEYQMRLSVVEMRYGEKHYIILTTKKTVEALKINKTHKHQALRYFFNARIRKNLGLHPKAKIAFISHREDLGEHLGKFGEIIG